MGKKSRHHELFIDIVEEILFCLSVKTLTRFMCVSKTLCSLISSPAFQQEHHHRRLQEDPVLITAKYKLDTQNNCTTTLHLSPYKNKEGLTHLNSFSKLPGKNTLINSCFGLICMYSQNHTILIFNPIMAEILTLPRTVEFNSCLGFGFAVSTKEFKVVRFFEFIMEDKSHCEVFTLGTNNWREATNPPYRVRWSRAPFIDGAIYLMPNEYGGPDTDRIIAFDVENEAYRDINIRFPQFYHTTRVSAYNNFLHLTELQGSLCLNFISQASGITIWLLKDKINGQWVKEYDIDFSGFIDKVFYALPSVIMRDGTILINVVGTGGHRLLSYNSRSKIVTPRIGNIYFALPFVESFFPTRLSK